MQAEIDVFLRQTNATSEIYEFATGWVNVAKKVGVVVQRKGVRTVPILSFAIVENTKGYRKAGSPNIMLCVDADKQTTFNLSGEAVKLTKEATEMLDVVFDENIWESMIPGKIGTVRVLAICIISAIIGGAIVYQAMNQPDPALWKEFLEWRETVKGIAKMAFLWLR
jgi:hypothetical protein